jgi:hypothetical protein
MIMRCFYHLLLTLFLSFNLYATERYQLIDLGLLNHQASEATSINKQGQICGTYRNYNKNYVYIWDPVQKINYTRIRTSVKPLINNHTEIFGSQWLLATDGFWEFDQESIFCWNNPLSYFTFLNITGLGFPKDASRTSPSDQERTVLWGANDHRQLIVMDTDSIKDLFQEAPWGFKYRVWIYHNGTYKQINHAQFHVGLSINNQSQVLGCFCEDKDVINKNHRVMTSVYDIKDGTTRVLKFPGPSIGRDINDHGQVVGTFYNPLTNETQGFMGDPSSNLLVFDCFSPYALNNQNQAIGKFLAGEKKDKPAIWDNGQLFDLMEVVDLRDDQGHLWDSLNELIDINDENYIIGKGRYKGATHGFLLVPISS